MRDLALQCSSLVEESLKKILDPDPDANDFQNLISSSLFEDTPVVKFPRRSAVGRFYVKLLTFRQTDRQTPGETRLPWRR